MRSAITGRQKPNRKIMILSLISYLGNVAVIFAYFYPLDPSGALIYFGWFTLGWGLFWLGLPRVADIADWARLIRKKVNKRIRTRN